jgi:hypothetical protein
MKITYTVTDKVRIKNVVGTGERTCKCGSWLKHWEKLSRKSAYLCSVEKCTEKATAGAHITRPNAKNEDYITHPYIVPMCSEHNGKHGAEYNSKPNTTFVWANVSKTCGK